MLVMKVKMSIDFEMVLPVPTGVQKADLEAEITEDSKKQMAAELVEALNTTAAAHNGAAVLTGVSVSVVEV